MAHAKFDLDQILQFEFGKMVVRLLEHKLKCLSGAVVLNIVVACFQLWPFVP